MKKKILCPRPTPVHCLHIVAWLSERGRDFALINREKSATNMEASEPFKTDFTIFVFFRLKRRRKTTYKNKEAEE